MAHLSQDGIKGSSPPTAPDGTDRPEDLRLELRIANLEHIRRAYGRALADTVTAHFAAQMARILDGAGYISPSEVSHGFKVLIFSPRRLGICAVPADREEWLDSLCATISTQGVPTPKGNLHIALSGLWLEDGEGTTQLQPDSHHDRQEILVFTGRPPGSGQHWARQYRQDMALADEFIEALASPDTATSFSSVAWQPVVSADGLDEVLFYDVLSIWHSRQGQGKAVTGHVDAMARLGLSGLMERKLALRIMVELDKAPDLALCLHISASSAHRRSLLGRTILARLAQNSWPAHRLVVAILVQDDLGDIGGLLQFCHALREAGCKIALPGFGEARLSLRDMVALRPDIVRIDSFFVRHARLALGPEGDEAQAHLIGLARALAKIVVADGVAAADEAERCCKHGARWQQGPHWGESRIYRASPAAGLGQFCRLASATRLTPSDIATEYSL